MTLFNSLLRRNIRCSVSWRRMMTKVWVSAARKTREDILNSDPGTCRVLRQASVPIKLQFECAAADTEYAP